MPVSPSSAAQAAREAVAGRLQDLRKEAGLTIVELAHRCGWHYSKTSRIENALTGPTATDIRKWCEATRTQDQAQDLVVQSINAESMYREWRHQIRRGQKQLQESLVQFYRDTELFRVYSSTLVPGLLQTEGYAAAVLRRAARFRDLPIEDSAEAARARVERSRVIHEQGHRFVIVVEESVLRYQMADSDAMAAQLGHLLTAGALPHGLARHRPDGGARTDALAGRDVQRVRRRTRISRTRLRRSERHAALRDRPVPEGVRGVASARGVRGRGSRADTPRYRSPGLTPAPGASKAPGTGKAEQRRVDGGSAESGLGVPHEAVVHLTVLAVGAHLIGRLHGEQFLARLRHLVSVAGGLVGLALHHLGVPAGDW